ncbi:MAG: hypothetical protein WBJ10_15550 [Daejeonella sp.]|uniref:hypothetical protein n=1 Tax=Daejeonella sp. TaxID=2805397 RepID=UPI003C76EBB3
MTTGYIQFDFDILKYWASNGVEQLLVEPFECAEAREYGANMPFRLKPKNSTEQGHLYKLASTEVSEFAYNESEGLTFLVHESDLYITTEGEKKESWLSSPWRHVQELPILNRLSTQLSAIKVTL